MPVATDVEHVLALLRRGEVAAAVDAYGGDLLPGTNSPALSELAPYDSEVLEVCLASLARIGDRPHPAVPLLKGRLAVARR